MHSDPGTTMDDVEQLRARVHKLSDMVQGHEGTLREHGVLIDVNSRQLESVRQSAATIEQLHHAGQTMTAAIKTSELLLLEKISNLANDLGPIKRGVYWAVTLIIGAVLLAMMTLLLNGPPPRP